MAYPNNNGELPPGFTSYPAPPPNYAPQNVAPRPPYPAQNPSPFSVPHSYAPPPTQAYGGPPHQVPPPAHAGAPPGQGGFSVPPQFYNPMAVFMDPNVPQIAGPPPPAEPPRIAAVQVTIPKTEVHATDGKPFVLFHLEFKVGNAVFCCQKRFSDLLQVHECLTKHCRLARMPEFPQKRWFADMTTPANREERSRELQQYFTQLITNPEVLTSCEFHSELGMDKHFADQMRSVGDHMVAVREQEHERHELERRYEGQRNEAEARYAQDFHRGPAVAVPLSPGLVYFAPPVLRLAHPICLEFKESRWAHGDAVITGPGAHKWLQVTSGNCTHWHVSHDKQWSIANMRGERLIYLEEAFRPGSIKFRLFRMLTTPHGSPPLMQKICSIRRTPSANYVIKMGGMKRCRSTTLVRCDGNWSDSDFKFYVSGAPGIAAQVNKKMFASTDTYHIEVAAHQDILFFVALASCIDRMHHHHHQPASHVGSNHVGTTVYVGGGGYPGGGGMLASAAAGAALVSSTHHGGHHHHHHGHHGGHHGHHGGHHGHH